MNKSFAHKLFFCIYWKMSWFFCKTTLLILLTISQLNSDTVLSIDHNKIIINFSEILIFILNPWHVSRNVPDFFCFWSITSVLENRNKLYAIREKLNYSTCIRLFLLVSYLSFRGGQPCVSAILLRHSFFICLGGQGSWRHRELASFLGRGSWLLS